MSELMTVASYATLHGVTAHAIYNQINAGVIKLVGKGVIDREQADESWGKLRRVRVAANDDSDLGRRTAQAKIAGGIAKLRLVRHRLERLQARYVDRKASVADLTADIETLLTELKALPAAEAATVADQLGIEPGAARDLLEQFIDLALGELGDIAGEATAAAQAV